MNIPKRTLKCWEIGTRFGSSSSEKVQEVNSVWTQKFLQVPHTAMIRAIFQKINQEKRIQEHGSSKVIDSHSYMESILNIAVIS